MAKKLILLAVLSVLFVMPVLSGETAGPEKSYQGIRYI